MARARLHLICGNCGCNDEWEWQYVAGDTDASSDVYLSCKNCSTLHSLNDNAEPEEEGK